MVLLLLLTCLLKCLPAAPGCLVVVGCERPTAYLQRQALCKMGCIPGEDILALMVQVQAQGGNRAYKEAHCVPSPCLGSVPLC